jgi:hypothetical protein
LHFHGDVFGVAESETYRNNTRPDCYVSKATLVKRTRHKVPLYVSYLPGCSQRASLTTTLQGRTMAHAMRYPASQRGGSDSIPGHPTWDLWGAKWQSNRLLSEKILVSSSRSFNGYLYVLLQRHNTLNTTHSVYTSVVVVILSDKCRNKRPKHVVVNTGVRSVQSVVFAPIIRADIDSLGVFRLLPCHYHSTIHLLVYHQRYIILTTGSVAKLNY